MLVLGSFEPIVAGTREEARWWACSKKNACTWVCSERRFASHSRTHSSRLEQ